MPRQYIRREPPAQLTETLAVTVKDQALDALNAYRQARHAWLACTGAVDERVCLRAEVERAALELAGFVAVAVHYQLDEPDDFAGSAE